MSGVGVKKRETHARGEVASGDEKTTPPKKIPAWAAKSTTVGGKTGKESGGATKTPTFVVRPSLLSTEASRHSYKGFINLTVILLVS